MKNNKFKIVVILLLTFLLWIFILLAMYLWAIPNPINKYNDYSEKKEAELSMIRGMRDSLKKEEIEKTEKINLLNSATNLSFSNYINDITIDFLLSKRELWEEWINYLNKLELDLSRYIKDFQDKWYIFNSKEYKETVCARQSKEYKNILLKYFFIKYLQKEDYDYLKYKDNIEEILSIINEWKFYKLDSGEKNYIKSDIYLFNNRWNICFRRDE